MADAVFPSNANIAAGFDNMAIQLFGNRLFADQALYEYINEFLLVFVSPKSFDYESGKMSFHTSLGDELAYYVKPRMGLKRFIFYERSKKGIKIPVDEKAYLDMINVINEKIGDSSTDSNKIYKSVESIQDLFYGYATVLKNRSWTAQSLLPIAPELIFCEAMLNAKERLAMHKKSDIDATTIEMGFDFSRHNFMARGGEVYYLHILQALDLCTEIEKRNLQKLLTNLISANSGCFSSIANWVDETWIKSQDINPDKLWIKKGLGFIPATGYIECGRNTILELITFLSNEMHPITRIEILSKGIVFQIMRMMCTRTSEYLEMNPTPWIIDMRAKKSSGTVMKISADSYRRIEELFVYAVNKQSAEYINRALPEQKVQSPFEYLSKAKKHTLNLFKRLGKEMQCIIPLKGGYERFSLSEDLLKFLVLSLIRPQEKMTFDMFLDKLYRHFNIVIGPKQYKECVSGAGLDVVQANAFRNNELEFQDFLKATGFVRDLSDATAIVVNPYAEVENS